VSDEDASRKDEEPERGFIALVFNAAIILAAAVVLAISGMMLLRSMLTPRPTRDQAKLQAIKTEAELLMATYQTTPYPGVPEERQPPAIASLKPKFVMVDRQGVDIRTVPLFGGGWGYEVPRELGHRPQPEGRCDDVGQGVYWCHPH
jgi:hypothetical protein